MPSSGHWNLPFRRVLDAVQDLGIGLVPAAALADQVKALGMMGVEWVRLVIEAWRLPDRMVRAALGMVADRWVQSMLTGLGRHLLRSIGMGGTASPFL